MQLTATMSLKPKTSSRVLETAPMDSKTANIHFQSRLAFETDPSDVYTDIQNGETGFVVVDARTRETYMKEHVPEAVNLPYRDVNPGSTASFAKDKLIVTCCDGVFC